VAQERERLHPLPAKPFTSVFGVTRGVGKKLPLVPFEGGEYSVPDDHVGQDVWVRQQDDEIVIVHVGQDGAHEIARWEPTVPGRLSRHLEQPKQCEIQQNLDDVCLLLVLAEPQVAG
jgi:hypothetical protein